MRDQDIFYIIRKLYDPAYTAMQLPCSRTSKVVRTSLKKYFGFLCANFFYCCIFIKLWLNHCCHMDYFIYVLTTFLDLEHVRSFAVYAGQKALRFHKKYLNLCYKDEQRFETTWGWAINRDVTISKPLDMTSTVWYLLRYKKKTNEDMQRK